MLVPIDDLTIQEISPPRKVTPVLPAEVARRRLEAAVADFGLSHELSPRAIFKMAVALKFPSSPISENKYRLLLKIGGELVFILAREFQDKSSDDLTALFKAIDSRLIYKRTIVRGKNAKELQAVWVYVEIEARERQMPDYGVLPLSGREGWPERFRQPVGIPPLWSCF